MSGEGRKLGVVSLAALVVGAMIGGGIFSLPQNMAQGASVCAVIAAWIITGIGIFFLANTFRVLAVVRPDATTGIYAYARLGFGRFAGFQMAWSYWLCNIFGNVGYAVLLMDAFNYFFPGVFPGGNNLWSVIGGSVVIWIMNFAVLRGVRQAAFVNTVGTVFKLMPIALFIIVMIFVFRWNCFSSDMCGHADLPQEGIRPLGDMMKQIKSTMLVTLWAFIGIEGAVVVSGRARSQHDVGKATVLGFLACLAIYAMLSILPFGYMEQHELAKLANPSTAPLLQQAVRGAWGGDIMNIGVIIALLTSWLAFTIMISQIPWAAAQDGTFPAVFGHENGNAAPDVSLWVTSGIMQIAMIFVYFANNAWNTMLSITAVMILPAYLSCTLYLWKICVRGEFPERAGVGRGFALLCGAAGSVYALWMIYAAGLRYLLAAFCFMVVGIPVFIWARKNALALHPEERDRRIFTKHETSAVAVMLIVSAAALIAISTGKISL